MIDEDVLKYYGFGSLLGGGAGFLLHKKLRIPVGLGIVLGVGANFFVSSYLLKIKQKKTVEGYQKRLECMKKYNYGQAINTSQMTKEQMIARTIENEKNAKKYGALCNSYMVK